jgi:Leucine-rich repeat (LRR) protein
LKILDLGYNRLKSIPSAIGGLESLEKIVLWYNQISGAIPDTIGQLSNIQGL